MKAVLGIAAAAALLAAGQAAADDQLALSQKSGCVACHQVGVKGLGPAYKDVAKKYAGQKDAEAKLAGHIIKGTGPVGLGWMKEGKASMAFMPPNAALKPEDAAKLAKWILGLK
ncbi:MAG: c-type cytochrome [Gammaproteobacteria bacterium]|nr:c-type cytochrome [Gammaproteobacteria bacterium]